MLAGLLLLMCGFDVDLWQLYKLFVELLRAENDLISDQNSRKRELKHQ